MMASDAPTKTSVSRPSILRHHPFASGTSTYHQHKHNQNRLLNVPDIKIIVIDGDDAADDNHTINSRHDVRPDAIRAEKKHGRIERHQIHRSVDDFNVDDLLVAYRNYRRHSQRRIDDDDIDGGHSNCKTASSSSRSRHQPHHLHHSRRHLREYADDYLNDYEDDVCEDQDVDDCDYNDIEGSQEENDEHRPSLCSCEFQLHIHRRNRFAFV